MAKGRGRKDSVGRGAWQAGFILLRQELRLDLRPRSDLGCKMPHRSPRMGSPSRATRAVFARSGGGVGGGDVAVDNRH